MVRAGSKQLIAMAAASLVAATPVVGWTWTGTSAGATLTSSQAGTGLVVPGACPTTITGVTDGSVNAPTATPNRVAAPDSAYYGNPKIGVQIATATPGLCPSFPDSTPSSTDQLPDLAGFVLRATPDPATVGAPTPTCATMPVPVSTVIPGTDGTCEMDPAASKAFPMNNTTETFDFTVASTPLGFASDPDFGSPQHVDALVLSCNGDIAGTDSCADSETDVLTFFDSPTTVFNYIGVFRHIIVDVTNPVTGKPMAGVTVNVGCTVPTGQPSDVCPASPANAISNTEGKATFAGLYAPGAPLTLAETGLPAPYRSVTTKTSAPSPVTKRMTTGAEISAAAEIPAVLAVAPTASLATVKRQLYEGKSIHLAGLGAATPGLPTLAVTSVGQPRHGTAVLHDGLVTYTPQRRYVGPDHFTYTAGSGTGVGGTGTVALTVKASPRVDTAWFHDPISASGRRAEVPVPSFPSGDNGPLRNTQATSRTHSGSIAVPVYWAYGHTLVSGEALTLTGPSLFAFNSAALTTVARAKLGKLAQALTDVRGVTCEGYTDFGGVVSHEQTLSIERALSVCSFLQKVHHDIAIKSVGYGGDDPVVVGAGAATSAQNRRVVIVITKSIRH